MEKQRLHYTVQIDAPVQKVWAAMLDDAGYREWTSVFNEGGSFYEGSWEQGSTIRFLGPGDDPSMGGMIATVAQNRPHEYISLEYTGQILDGEVDTTSDMAKRIIGGQENYTFTESGGVTTVTVDVDTDDEFKEMFAEAWPKGLAKLKEIAER